MARLTKGDVLKLASLAKLSLTDEEAEKFQAEFSDILKYVEQLQQVDVAGLEPTNQVTGLKNVTRKDVIKDYGVSSKDLLKNAPATEKNQIKVKRVL